MRSARAKAEDRDAGAPNGHRDDWDRHWDAIAEATAKNPAQAYRRRLAVHLLERRGPPRRLLDIGSGQGDFALQAVERWPAVDFAGLEMSAGGIRISERKVPGAEFHQVDLMNQEHPPADRAGWATHALCSEVLEHVDDAVRVLRHARAWLAPGCRVVVTVPGGPMSEFDRHIGHRAHFTPQRLRDVLIAAGYEPLLTTRAGFPFFNVYRTIVVARGRRLVDDVAHDANGLPLAARVAMAGFGALFALTLPRSPFGWQIVGVATVPCSA